MRVAVITVAAGRHEHLRAQRRGISGGERRPDRHYVVAMGDPAIGAILAGSPGVTVSAVDLDHGRLPLARARNHGAELALADGAELLIFLDVDCIPAAGLVRRYVEAAESPAHADALLCGPVTYLPPAPPGGYLIADLPALADPHPARPAPAGPEILRGTDYDLFWSLSFAVRAPVWRTIGGFCEQYRGYGGEDTDLAWTARTCQVGIRWVGGADAYHQYHPVSDPPVEHLDDILLNAATFHDRWGAWPMPGWLAEFRAAGLTEFDPDRDRWVRAQLS